MNKTGLHSSHCYAECLKRGHVTPPTFHNAMGKNSMTQFKMAGSRHAIQQGTCKTSKLAQGKTQRQN